MIVNASGRTDVPAYYSKWFMNRLHAGFFDVRNPFQPKMVSRIRTERIDAFMFCTKNPLPLIPYLKEIDKPILMDVTLTPYHREIEPHVPDKQQVVEGIQEISKILGPDHVSVRYDPVFLTPRYTADYHIRAFEKLCSLLEGYITEISVSILDMYKNTRKNAAKLGLVDFTEEDHRRIAEGFAKSAKAHGIHVFTCCENQVWARYGIEEGGCFSQMKAFEMTGKAFPKWKSRNCECAEMSDVGAYNTCLHGCLYCYANFDEKQILDNVKQHDPESTMLIGHLQPDDVVKEKLK